MDGGPLGVAPPLGRDEERACRLRPSDASLRGSRGVGALSEPMARSMSDDMIGFVGVAGGVGGS